MADPEVFPDVEGALRTWLRAQPEVAARYGTRVFFGIPDSPTWPLLVVGRVGGGEDVSEAPLDLPMVQLDCWGRLDTAGHGDKASCAADKNAVRSALSRIRAVTELADGEVAFGAEVVSDLWSPDPDDKRPRYVLTVRLAAIAVAA